MKFLKENSYDILRLFINQIGVTIFSFFLYTAVGMIEDSATKTYVNVAVSVVSMLFYFFLLYTVAWEWGAKDKIRIDAGRQSCFKFKGALMSLYANVINFLLSAAAAMSIGFYMLSEKVWLLDTYFVVNLIMRFLSTMYIGITGAVFAGLNPEGEVIISGVLDEAQRQLCLSCFLQSLSFFILPILSILVTHLAYVFGLREKKIFSKQKKQK